jgi:ferric-chelate reductase
LLVNRGKQESHEAVVETISRDSIKLRLPNRKITWKAGQHVFLILPGVSTVPFESHPFTIANIPDRDANGRSKPTDLVFYIRAMDGFTRKLHDYAALHNGQTVVALADGPYGRPPPVNTFSTVVLIAGEDDSMLKHKMILTRYTC